MCSPLVMSSVREGLSRRGFLGAAAGCAVVASVNAQQQPVRLPKGFRDVIDLTHTFSPALPVYPDTSLCRFERVFRSRRTDSRQTK